MMIFRDDSIDFTELNSLMKKHSGNFIYDEGTDFDKYRFTPIKYHRSEKRLYTLIRDDGYYWMVVFSPTVDSYISYFDTLTSEDKLRKIINEYKGSNLRELSEMIKERIQ